MALPNYMNAYRARPARPAQTRPSTGYSPRPNPHPSYNVANNSGIGIVADGTPAPARLSIAQLRQQFQGPRTYRSPNGLRYTKAWSDFLTSHGYGGQSRPGAAPPTPGPAAPVAAAPSGPRVFFNPLSSTLWSTEDGRDYSLPADLSSVNFMDSNLPNGLKGMDAAYYWTSMFKQGGLSNAIRPVQRLLDELGDPNAATSQYQTKKSDALREWTRESDNAMTSAAMRGVYDSGMRTDSASQLLKALTETNDVLDKTYGFQRLRELNTGMSDVRSQFANEFLQDLFAPGSPYQNKLAADVEEAIERGASGAAGAGAGGGAAAGGGGAPRPAAPRPAGGGGGIGIVPAGTPAPVAPSGARLTMAQALERFRGARTYAGGTRRTAAWSDFLRRHGLA